MAHLLDLLACALSILFFIYFHTGDASPIPLSLFVFIFCDLNVLVSGFLDLDFGSQSFYRLFIIWIRFFVVCICLEPCVTSLMFWWCLGSFYQTIHLLLCVFHAAIFSNSSALWLLWSCYLCLCLVFHWVVFDQPWPATLIWVCNFSSNGSRRSYQIVYEIAETPYLFSWTVPGLPIWHPRNYPIFSVTIDSTVCYGLVLSF